MISLTVLVLLALGANRVAAAAACGECAGDGCKVLETVRVEKLCASQLCVNGSSVVVSDGDPCTSDDIIAGKPVHLPIKNCCTSAVDCQNWLEEPACIDARCVLSEEVPTHGFCEFTPIPDCCTKPGETPNDCAEKACKVATCKATVAQPLRYSEQHKRFVDIPPQELVNIPGTCEHADAQDCCLNSRDCLGKCQPGELGICDKGMTCICVPTSNNECTIDEDCAGDEAAKRVCEEGCDDETKPPCYYYECDRGWCTCVFDPDRDFDNDGVCCKDDCDDRNPDVKDKIFCPLVTTPSPDQDGDGFNLCKIVVVPTCDATCPGGLTPVPIEDTEEIGGQRVLLFNCDCCDDNDGGLDQPLVCAKDENGNGIFAPSLDCVDPTLPCEKCYEEVCVLQPESGKITDTTTLNGLCVAEFDAGYVAIVPPQTLPVAPCDFCDSETGDGAGNLPERFCPLEYPIGETFQNVCPQLPGGPPTGTTVELCCEHILDQTGFEDGLHPDFAQLRVCCLALQAADYAGECNDMCPDGGLFPGKCNQCNCENDWATPCNAGAPAFSETDTTIQCVEDVDTDGYYNCTQVYTACYSTRFLPEGTLDEKCATVFGAEGTKNFVSLETARQTQDDGVFTGTFCDCNDNDTSVFQQLACGVDEDGDGFLKCKDAVCSEGLPVRRTPVCELVCAATCPVPITQANCEQPPRPTRTQTTLEKVKAAAAKHGWSAAAATQKLDPTLPPRVDGECNDEIRCENCDCCDTDSYVHPLSPFGTAVPNKCGNFDMNCDCMYHSTVACEPAVSDPIIPGYYSLSNNLGPNPDDTDDFSVGIRNLGNATATKYTLSGNVTFEFTATPDRLGYCGDDCAQLCADYLPGISLESQFGGPNNRRRAISIQLQKSCVELVSLKQTNLDANHNIITLTAGQCFEFIEACGKPCNADGQCNADCEICTKLWS